MRHIRQGNENVRDHRFRSTSKYANKLRPVLCGGEPSMDDLPRDGGSNILGIPQSMRPSWAAEICPACAALVMP